MKRILAPVLKCLRTTYWATTGGHRVKAFGQKFSFSAATGVPNYQRYRLPRHFVRENNVQYTDHVQMRAICSYLAELPVAPTIVEVGAYTGAYACILGKIVSAKNGRVIAIEPEPENCKLLRENVAKNDLQNVVTVEEIAVSDFEGMATITSDASQSSIRLTPSAGEEGIRVRTESLRSVLRRNGVDKVDLLLVDVEGAELPVLRGFPWEDVAVERIFCELHPYAWRNFGYTSVDADAFFAERGYLPIDMFLRPWNRLPDSAHWSIYIGPTLLHRCR